MNNCINDIRRRMHPELAEFQPPPTDRCFNQSCPNNVPPLPDTAVLEPCYRCQAVLYCSKDCQKATCKRSCKRPNYIIKVSLGLFGEVRDPPIERTLSCPAHATFGRFHRALKLAFGWTGQSNYDFRVVDEDTGKTLLRVVDPMEEVDEYDDVFDVLGVVEKEADGYRLWNLFETAKYKGK